MRTKILNVFQPAGTQQPLLHPAELTQLSWATAIRSFQDIPEAYQGIFEPLLAGGRAFPYTVLTPSHERFLHLTTEKLISDLGSELVVLERMGERVESHCFPLESISHVEVRSMLLYFHVRISAVTGHGIPETITLKCSAITDYLLTPILQRIRSGRGGDNGPVLPAELEKFDELAATYYKFMSYARHSLLGGERVIQIIFQPEIRPNLHAALSWRARSVSSPAHLLILTDRECIWIRDDECREDEAKHGAIWEYIPLGKIEALTLHPLSLRRKNERLLGLTIHLPAGEQLELVFQTRAQAQLERFQEHLRRLASRIRQSLR